MSGFFIVLMMYGYRNYLHVLTEINFYQGVFQVTSSLGNTEHKTNTVLREKSFRVQLHLSTIN
jgi:hypothetical protein